MKGSESYSPSMIKVSISSFNLKKKGHMVTLSKFIHGLCAIGRTEVEFRDKDAMMGQGVIPYKYHHVSFIYGF